MAIAPTPTLRLVPVGATLDRQLEELAQLRDLGRLMDQLDGQIAVLTRQREDLQARFDEILNRRLPT